MRLQMLCLLVFVLMWRLPASAQDQEEAAWAALRSGEAILLMRHALAPGTGDPANFQLGDCSTQRNLSEEGRRQARSWRPFFADRGITEVRLFSSQWCRCIDTANEMAMGEVTPLPPINSFFRNRAQGPRQTRELKDAVNAMPAGKPIVLVSHQVNITALTGVFPASNEGLIIALPLTESVNVLARVAPGN